MMLCAQCRRGGSTEHPALRRSEANLKGQLEQTEAALEAAERRLRISEEMNVDAESKIKGAEDELATLKEEGKTALLEETEAKALEKQRTQQVMMPASTPLQNMRSPCEESSQE